MLNTIWLESSGVHTNGTDNPAKLTIASYKPGTEGPTVFDGHTTHQTAHGAVMNGTLTGHFDDQTPNSVKVYITYPNGHEVEHTGTISPDGNEIRGTYASQGIAGEFIWRKQGIGLDA
jgi:hypothetical protein